MGAAIPLHDAELVGAPGQLPPGEYHAYYLRHETSYFNRTPKVYVHFRVYGGDYHGAEVYRAFKVERLRGKPRKGGAFKVRHTSELYRQFVMLTEGQERPDRISLQRLRGTMVRISVRTVTSDYRQRELPPALQYSVVDRIIAVETGKV